MEMDKKLRDIGKIAEKKFLNPENLWSDVSDKTETISIFTAQNYKNRGRYPPKFVAVNIADYPTLVLKDLSRFPKFSINIKKIYIMDIPTLRSLKGLPSELPSLERFKIRGTQIDSLQYFPESLPRLKKLEITKTNIRTLKYLPSELPALEYFDLSNNKLISFKGLPRKLPSLKELKINDNQLTSWLDYPDISIFGKMYPKIQKYGNPIRTLSGIEEYRLRFFVGGEHSFRSLRLCPRGMRLVRDWMDIKIKEGLVLKLPTEEFPEYRLVRDPERYKVIAEFYRKTPMELTQQYIESPESLTEGELERLSWEGGYQERQLLESNFPPDNLLLKEISKRLTHTLSSGLSLLK